MTVLLLSIKCMALVILTLHSVGVFVEDGNLLSLRRYSKIINGSFIFKMSSQHLPVYLSCFYLLKYFSWHYFVIPKRNSAA